jgi:DNA (cytosine-5)-methyltransferase 1
MTEAITYGSICTGYDGIGLGLALAGVPIRPLWLAEVEPAMSRVLKREHDGVPNVGDVKVAPWQLAPHVSLMSSGDPCQSISIAGRQAGREDPRFLWPWVREAYRAVLPDVLFFENVANIVSHDKGRTLGERFEHLREDGYEVRWCVLGACAVGAPLHRHRWYAVAVRWRGEGPPPAARRVDGGKAICGAPRSGGRFLLPTPVARDGDGRGEGDAEYWDRRLAERGRTNGRPLGAEVALLPTPDASMSTRGGMLSPAAALRRIADNNRSSNLDDAVASLLPTPVTSDGTAGPGRTENREGGDDLRTLVVRLLPTPRASDGENGRGNPGQVYGSGTLPLSGAVALLPTPMADRSGSNVGGAAGRGPEQEVRYSLDSVHKLLPTPMVGDAQGGHSEPEVGGDRPSGAKRMDSLGSVARLMPTPTTSNVSGNRENNRGELLLPGIVQPEVWGKYAESVALWEFITGVPAPAPTEPGAKGAPRLSAALPEWMMGLRPGLLTDELSRPEALKGAGNGCVPLAVAAAWHVCTAPLD